MIQKNEKEKMTIEVIVPCYNEEEVLHETVKRLGVVASEVAQLADGLEMKLMLVDDGSRDSTWAIISNFAAEQTWVQGLKLAHNAGHQNALWAGMQEACGRCDAMVSIDADLQDDEHAIVEMVRQFLDGKDVVYGVRKERATDTVFKRTTAQAFYGLMRSAGTDLVYNHADFRLLSARALAALMEFPERNLFLRGMVRLLGFNEGFVTYARRSRFAGTSKYPLAKMLSFAADGITSFSIVPLRLITGLGFLFVLVAVGIIVYAIVQYARGEAIPGWTSMLVSLWFIGGALLLAIGVTGTYIGKIYKEIKRRPRFIVEERRNL